MKAWVKQLPVLGKNVYHLSSSNGTTRDYYAPDVTVAKAGKPKYKIAQTQIHNSYEDRTEVVRETYAGYF